MKTCIVNFATKSKWYPKGQRRLLRSLEAVGFKGSVFNWLGEESLGCRLHSEVPYTYKTYALWNARAAGFDQALWLDCSMWAVAPLEPMFELLRDKGQLMVDSGWQTGQWCTDDGLSVLGYTRDEMMAMPMLSSGFVGLDFSNEVSHKFLDDWHHYSSNTTVFRGPWNNKNNCCSADPRVLGHRHDQTVASVLAFKHGIKLCPNGTPFAYAQSWRNGLRDNVYVIAEGL